ncbi:B-cell scaffold protein with ankyrin repeats-like isoform X2 [Ostrea edulis]|uniref:B-cell scaffold protein with ankyrin repeats-like isoform X2 n=1 Tax=Ostrea edulis TaxID=37623 RepID=UPI0024AEF576|nr:B-cell scaffold protein with ankyrin repeats-like isoform X2 [Ostrea edulis]
MEDDRDPYTHPSVGEETDTDLYLPMRPKLERGSILVIHTHEGEPIAEFIKNNLERFNDQFHINVSTCDVNEVESRNLAYQVTILLITKETISHLESITDSPCPSLQFHTNTTCAFLVHESVCIEDEHVKTVLENKIPNFSVWKPLKIQSVRSTVIDIVNLLDQTEESFPPTLQYHLEPNYIVTDKTQVFILFKSEKKMTSSVVVHVDRKKMDTRHLNAYTYSFCPNGLPYGKNPVNIFVDGKSVGTTNLTVGNKMDFLYEEIEDLHNPVEFLCQSLKLSTSNREQLDRELGDRINDQVIANFGFMNGLDQRFSWRDQKVNTELPTMLHFGAKFGLACFCKVLMKVPGFQIAQTIRNKDNEIPSQIAQRMGFSELSRELDVSQFMSSNYSLARLNRSVTGSPPLLPRSRQRSASDRTDSESSFVSIRSCEERTQIHRRRNESGLFRISGQSRDSGISARSDVFEGFDSNVLEEMDERSSQERVKFL